MSKHQIKIGNMVRIYRDLNLNYKPWIWLDPEGCPYDGVPDTPASRKCLARQLREAAKWVEKP